MINSVQVIDCSDCNGVGVIFYGDDYDYSVEPCGCTEPEGLQWQGIAQNNYAENNTQPMVAQQQTTIEVITRKKKQMKVTITTMSGNTSSMDLPTKENVHYFIELYRNNLKKNQRVKITCDLLGIDGYLQGTAPIR